MAAIWRWCALGSIWCVSPGYCHGSAKGCHHGHPTSQTNSRSSTFSRTETKFKFISLPLRKVAQEKMVWAGRATAIPPNFTFFSARLARHRSILLRMNWNFWYPWPWKQTQNFEIYCQLFFFKICTRPLNRASFSDRPVSFGPLFPPPPFVDLPFTVGPVSKVGSSSNYYLLVDSSSNLNPFSFSLSISWILVLNFLLRFLPPSLPSPARLLNLSKVILPHFQLSCTSFYAQNFDLKQYVKPPLLILTYKWLWKRKVMYIQV